jgi:uncharacterized membrane protein
MKPFQLLALVCASFLWVSPVHAHGDEAHGGAANAAAPATASPANNSGEAQELLNEASGDAHASGGHDQASGETADVNEEGIVDVLKKLHPATIHFPIALFLMAALAELFIGKRREAGLEPAVRVLIYGGAGGAVIAAIFGWIHTGLWFGGDTAMQLHRWNGMLIAVLGLVLAALAHRRPESRTALRIALFSMAVLILAQGFLGGELAHGPDHLGISWL